MKITITKDDNDDYWVNVLSEIPNKMNGSFKLEMPKDDIKAIGAKKIRETFMKEVLGKTFKEPY